MLASGLCPAVCSTGGNKRVTGEEIGFSSVWDGPIFSLLLRWPREGLRYGCVIGIHVSLGGMLEGYGDLRRA
jgi:hypothetical protein